ncbi:MAG: hypothetical protein P8X46_08575, partial [Nitrospirales bacterium]
MVCVPSMKRENRMWLDQFSVGFLCLILMNAIAGCSMPSAESDKRQADIGFGIVEGTKGYQQIQKNILPADEATRKVQGQVFQIEGAAYVVHLKNRTEVRLPVDENTRIDRPAHVGDWIEAHMDQAGRARIIRNIDDQIILE